MYRRVKKAQSPMDYSKYEIITGAKPDGNWEHFIQGRDKISEGAKVWIGPEGGHYFDVSTGTKNGQKEQVNQTPKAPQIKQLQTENSKLKQKLKEEQALLNNIEQWKEAEPKKVYKPSPPTNPPYMGSLAAIARNSQNDFSKFAIAILAQDMVVFDYETTGLGIRDYPVQLGAVRIRNGKVIDRFHYYMNPERKLGDWSLSNLKRQNENGELEGLTDEWLSQQPSMEEVHRKFVEFAGNSFLCAHNNVFDLNILNKVLKKKGIEYRPSGALDTLSFARGIIPKEEVLVEDFKTKNKKASYTLGNLAKVLNIKLDNAHSADADAEATGELAYKLIQYGMKHGTVRSDFLDVERTFRRYARDVREYKEKKKNYPKDRDKYDAEMIEWRSKDPTLKKSEEGSMLSLAFQMAAEALRYGKYR